MNSASTKTQKTSFVKLSRSELESAQGGVLPAVALGVILVVAVAGDLATRRKPKERQYVR